MDDLSLVNGVPFTERRTAHLPRANNIHRLKIFRKHCKLQGRVLDIGEANYISKELGIKDNTWGDLNYELNAHRLMYGTITCFEVLNHILNPLSFMKRIYERLWSGGTLYLSTPKLGFIAFYHSKGNFVEYKQEKLEALFNYVGFEVVKVTTHRAYPVKFIFYGVRSPFKWFFHKFQLYELRKI